MSQATPIYLEFPGRIVLVGFGSIGQGVLPLILQHIGIAAERLAIVSADDVGREEAARYNVKFIKQALTRETLRRTLEPLLGRGDFLVNVSVDVSSIALIRYCWERGAMYLDTCIEPWPGGYTDPTIPADRRTNYALREEALALRADNARAPTAVVTHGANPGLVSHLVKRALLNIAQDTGAAAAEPASRAAWAALAQRLGVKVIHVAERDTQVSTIPKEPNEFVNTWSVDGFVSEGSQPAELGWGTHERNFPRDGRRYGFGAGAAIYLSQPGVATRARSWTPLNGPFHGFLITHSEAISIADYYTARKDSQVTYRPTVHYAYHPSDATVLSVHEFCGRNYQMQARKRILMDDISAGIDELGVMLAGHKRNAYWYGSRLSVQEARALAPFNNATSLQVAAAVLAGMVWAMENPNEGLVEPDEVDFHRCLDICTPYLGQVVGQYSDWTPLTERERLFPEDLDKSDPWQFKNVRVS
ncbi:MAG TPA: saccharopine dehydrogenase C-terminal domain-containing protein [Steroidobacteraceae bacterium]|jgi:homospermidine synthase|nr:saccharopine dehydrogenase C-terminal domain-containing protein [Steroidobacteraceae bacterium]